MISAVTNQGRMAFSVFRERFDSDVFLAFLKRLARHAGRKAFLIRRQPPGTPLGQGPPLGRGLDGADPTLLPPAYSPDPTPDEMLNHDVKANGNGTTDNGLSRSRPRRLGPGTSPTGFPIS